MTDSRCPASAPPEPTANQTSGDIHLHGDEPLAPPLPLDVTFHVPAETASVPLVRRLVRAALLGAGIDQDLIDDVTLATDEACTNVVLHGARTHDERPSYDVGLHITPDRCVVTVAEREVGCLARVCSPPPPPPSPSPSPELRDMADTASEHGRGIALMSLLMDAVQFETDPTGNFRLLLEKGLRRADDRMASGAALVDRLSAGPPLPTPDGAPGEPSAT